MKDKKNKKYKLDDEERKMIDCFKSCVESEIATCRYTRYADFEEVHNDEGYQITAVLDYGKFKAKLFYNPSYFLSDMLDVKFDLGGQFLYSIYDIFNLFDIQDFNQYYYSDIQFEENMQKGVHAILEMINSYSFDIEKASEPANLITLNSNVESDYKNVYSKDDEESWREDLNKPFELDINHPFFSEVSSATDSDKLLKKMKKLNSKDKLTTLYEKRLLKHLEQGNQVINDFVAEDEKLTKNYSKMVIAIDVAITAVVTVLVGLVLWLGNYAAFKGAFVPKSYTKIGFISLPDDIIFFLIVVVLISFGLASLLIKPIYKRLTKADDVMMKRFAKEQSDDGNDKLINRIFRGIASVVAIIIGVGMVIFSLGSGIGFYEDYIKFTDDYTFETVEVSNADVQIMKVLGEYDENDEYVPYDETITYVLTDGENHYYELYNVKENDETDKRIKDMISAYDKEVKEIKTMDVFTDTLNIDE